jgi:hypothetical protein
MSPFDLAVRSGAAMAALVYVLGVAGRRQVGRRDARRVKETRQVAFVKEDTTASRAVVDNYAAALKAHHSGVALGAAQDRIRHVHPSPADLSDRNTKKSAEFALR